MSEETPPNRLNVLPHSGKVEQLRQELEQEKARTDDAPAPPAADAAPTAAEMDPAIAKKLLEGKVIAQLQKVYDPEIPVNIYELGLIYSIDIDDQKRVTIRMTLTAPACPVAGTLPGDVERRVETIDEVASCKVDLVWEPPWSKDMMSESAMLQLGFL